MAEITRDVNALRALLAERTFDLRTLDVNGFRAWLARQRQHWQNDPVFAQRSRIRDLRRSHPQLRSLERAFRRALAADAAAPQFHILSRLARDRARAHKAIAGLTAAMESASPERRPAMEAKRAAFEVRLGQLLAEESAVVAGSPERQALLAAEAEIRQLRAAIGLDQAEAELDALARSRGRRSGRSGNLFEQTALALAEQYIVPDLLAAAGDIPRDAVRLLQGVTLGAARTEIDLLVVRVPPAAGEPAEVLAMVEFKRNINDLAHGFARRQENLAWLTGDSSGYDPGAYRTHKFPKGHFDRPAEHRQGAEVIRLTRDSFARFGRDPASGLFLDGLYLVTRAGNLWGLSAARLARLAMRVASDPRWAPESDDYLSELLTRARSLAGPFESPDVLRLYAESPTRARQLIVDWR